MEVLIKRRYAAEGTNGELYINQQLQCYTIELPWLENRPKVSCIPEGRYLLRWRRSKKFGRHLEVVDVEGRSLILIHPANNALRELRGCIAPVSRLGQVPGVGSDSRAALKKVFSLLETGGNEQHYLLIQKQDL